jgi:hypothetical protein
MVLHGHSSTSMLWTLGFGSLWWVLLSLLLVSALVSYTPGFPASFLYKLDLSKPPSSSL